MVKYIVEQHILKRDAKVHDKSTERWLRDLETLLLNGTALQPAKVLPEVLKFIVDKLKAIKAAIARFQLEFMLPYIKEGGVEYERKHWDGLYEKALQSDPPQDPLRRARAWLIEAIAATKRVEGEELQLQIPDVCRVLRYGILAMVGSSQPASRITSLGTSEALAAGVEREEPAEDDVIFPETLVWDLERIVGFQNEVQLVIMVSYTMLICVTFLEKQQVYMSAVQMNELKTLREKLLRKPRPTLDAITTGIAQQVFSMMPTREERLLSDSERNRIAKGAGLAQQLLHEGLELV